MWKRRPVIGTWVGGIQDQIVDGVSGLLIDDPRDLDAVVAAITRLTTDRRGAEAMGEEARQRVREHFLAASRLIEYAELLFELNPDGD
jgi:trehalose synthase